MGSHRDGCQAFVPARRVRSEARSALCGPSAGSEAFLKAEYVLRLEKVTLLGDIGVPQLLPGRCALGHRSGCGSAPLAGQRGKTGVRFLAHGAAGWTRDNLEKQKF